MSTDNIAQWFAEDSKHNQFLLTERNKCSGYLPSGCVDARGLPWGNRYSK